MQNLSNKFEEPICQAIAYFEKEFSGDLGGELVNWGCSLDFFPDAENASETGVPLVATVGIYLELPGLTKETVVSGSIFAPPYLEVEQIYQAVFDSLVALRERREASVKP